MVRQTSIPPQAGSDASKRNYGGTSSAKTLAWIIASAVLFCGWLAYTYQHTFGADQFPEPNPSPQGVTYINDYTSVVRSVAQVRPNRYEGVREVPESRGVLR
jgi:hypothetical protein